MTTIGVWSDQRQNLCIVVGPLTAQRLPTINVIAKWHANVNDASSHARSFRTILKESSSSRSRRSKIGWLRDVPNARKLHWSSMLSGDIDAVPILLVER